MPHDIKWLNKVAELEVILKEEFLVEVNALDAKAQAPFSQGAIALLSCLSKLLLHSSEAKAFPQFIALGYWLRPSMLTQMKQSFEATINKGQTPTPRGTAFHLPPQNVDTLFVYSWAISVLAGNANVVRLPSVITDATKLLSRLVITALVESGEFGRHIFCAYDHSSGMNASISAYSDLRMVWGGDAKVRSVSVDPVRPDGISLGFPDRQSFAVINANAYQELPPADRDTFAQRLYNDVFWFDQLGCGSPKIVFWVGESADAADDLFERIVGVAHKKQYVSQAAVSISKFNVMNELLADGTMESGQRYGAVLDVLKGTLTQELLSRSHGGGLLHSVDVHQLQDVACVVDRKTQTIAHFGFDQAALQSLARCLVSKGGYRIVPVGEALNFEPIWDGVDLFRSMTRMITFR
jgi:hypothetical protein